jgi:putative FmdB family regulatory protein
LTITEGFFVPTYSYACTECDNKFDVVQAFTDDALTRCVKCDGRLRKLFGNVGVVFKGSGFYRTDSREAAKSTSNGSAKTSESPTSSESASSSSGTSEKKSDSAKSDSSSSSSSSGSSDSSRSGSSAPAAAASN